MNPREYGMPVKKYSGEIIPQRDSQDIALAKYVLEETKLPLLCICRGIQAVSYTHLGRVLLGSDCRAGQQRCGHCNGSGDDSWLYQRADVLITISPQTQAAGRMQNERSFLQKKENGCRITFA